MEEYLAESGEAEEDLALLQDMPSLPRLLWKLPWKELDNGPGEAGDIVSGDLDLTESVLDLRNRYVESRGVGISRYAQCELSQSGWG
jgi:hypothetical protein